VPTVPASAGAAGAATRAYRPRGCTDELKEIVEDHLEELVRVWDERFYRDHGPLHPRVEDLLERFVRCGDPHYGFVRLCCVNKECGKKEEKIAPFS